MDSSGFFLFFAPCVPFFFGPRNLLVGDPPACIFKNFSPFFFASSHLDDFFLPSAPPPPSPPPPNPSPGPLFFDPQGRHGRGKSVLPPSQFIFPVVQAPSLFFSLWKISHCSLFLSLLFPPLSSRLGTHLPPCGDISCLFRFPIFSSTSPSCSGALL